MRKRTIKAFADTVFWYMLYFLPVLAYLIFLFANPLSDSVNSLAFADFVSMIGFDIAGNNVIVNTLFGLFGNSGILPLFSSNTPFIIFGWFIGVYLLHLAVDFLLFIPKWCHRLMNDYTEGL